MDKVTHEKRAMKIFRKDELTKDGIIMIRREIELLQNFDHPNLCKIHAFFETEDKIYLLIDDFRGQSLFDYVMKQGALKEIETAFIAA